MARQVRVKNERPCHAIYKRGRARTPPSLYIKPSLDVTHQGMAATGWGRPAATSHADAALRPRGRKAASAQTQKRARASAGLRPRGIKKPEDFKIFKGNPVRPRNYKTYKY